MDRGRIVNWLIIFSLLTLFTTYAVVNSASNSTNKALAKLMESDPGMGNITHALIFEDTNDAPDPDAFFWDRFLNRFGRYHKQEKICALTQSQYNEIAGMQNTSIDILSVGGHDINVAKIEGDLEFSPNDIRRILLKTGDGTLSCRILRHNNFFYLLFSPQIS